VQKLVKHDLLFWLVIAAGLIPWLFIAAPQSINADNFLLADAMARWLHGMTMTEGLYYPNPPLCFLIYLPPVLLHEWLAVPLHYGIFAWALALLAAWSAALFAVLRRWDFLGPLETRVLLASFIAANSIMFITFFGEKDQMIGMALAAFTMVQLSLTFRLPCGKRLSWAVLAAGAVFILVKPHHGLLPTLLILHRAMRQRRLSALWDPDAVCLAAATVLYVAGIFAFFPEYVTQILPDTVRFYVPRKDFAAIALMTVRYGAAGLALAAVAAFFVRKSPLPQRNFAAFLGFATLVSLVPYVVQGHGYVYHLQPANTFLWMGMGLLTMMWLRDDSKLPLVSCVVAMAAMVDAAWVASVKDRPLPPTHAEYRQLPLVRMAADCGQPHCAVFIFNSNEEIALKISYYAKADLASRFGAYWFLAQMKFEQNELENGRSAGMTRAEIERYRHKFAKMTAEDLARWKPGLALIGRFPIMLGEEPFDLPAYFGDDQDFAREWAHYRKTGTVTARYDDYLPDTVRNKGSTLTYDVWRRASAP
jgi:hypothetical protein